MSDYIKREDAERMFMEYLCAEYHIYALNNDIEADKRIKIAIKISKEMFSHLKSADVAPIVRCKECKCWTEWSNGTGSCSRFALDWIGTDADDFCSMGERKDDAR